MKNINSNEPGDNMRHLVASVRHEVLMKHPNADPLTVALLSCNMLAALACGAAQVPTFMRIHARAQIVELVHQGKTIKENPQCTMSI